jgi:formylglycine-generating enzyme required for sulfatase activity
MKFTVVALIALTQLLLNTSFADQQFVFISSAGNAADENGRGAVSYNYSIGKYEVTANDYAVFLNSVAKTDNYGLYQSGMASDSKSAGIVRSGSSGSYAYAVISGSEYKPITHVSWYSSARYVNWLHNSANGVLGTETGVYNLNGAVWNNSLGSGQQQWGFSRSSDAAFWLPTIDEWYKAAYYDSSKGGSGGYWLYPNGSNASSGSTAVSPNSTFSVGGYAPSPFGTFDQAGNVFEIVEDSFFGSTPFRALGGSWNRDASYAGSGYTSWNAGGNGSNEVGFRIATVPEPTTLSFLALGGLALAINKRRRA